MGKGEGEKWATTTCLSCFRRLVSTSTFPCVIDERQCQFACLAALLLLCVLAAAVYPCRCCFPATGSLPPCSAAAVFPCCRVSPLPCLLPQCFAAAAFSLLLAITAAVFHCCCSADKTVKFWQWQVVVTAEGAKQLR